MKKVMFAVVIILFAGVSRMTVKAVDFSLIYENADTSVKEYVSKDELDDGAGLAEHLSPRKMFEFVKKSVAGVIPSLKPLIQRIIFCICAFLPSLFINDKSYVGIYDLLLCLISVSLLHSCIYPILSGAFIKLASLNGFLSLIYSYMAAGLAAGTKAVSAGMLPSTIVGILSLISNVISLFFVPLTGVLLSVTYASVIENGVLSKLLDSLKKLIVMLIGIAGIIFSGITGLQKYISSAGDGIGMSTARFVISGSMPIVGGVVKDAFGTVAASSKMIVSVSGIFGIISVVIMLLPYLIKLFLTLTVFRLALILCEGTGQSSIKVLLKGCAGVFEIVTALYACEMMYVIISISLLISAA